MRQFVTEEFCLKCDGCCRFKESASPWRPRLGESEREKLRAPSLVERIFSPANLDEKGYVVTGCSHGLHICSFLNPKDNTCQIYSHRPFECQLYPFVLTQGKGEGVMMVHLSCPFIGEKRYSPAFDEYVIYLKRYFQKPETLQFLKQNPSVFGDYSEYAHELESLFTIVST